MKSLTTKFLIPTLLLLAVLSTVIMWRNYTEIYSQITTQKKVQLKNMVDYTYGILESYNQKVVDGKMSLADAQSSAYSLIKGLRYGNDGYVFLIDMNGNVVADPELKTGQNVLNLHDQNGVYFIKNMIDISKNSGQGYTGYHFPKPPKNNVVLKESYVKFFKPWNIFIGTGVYFDDVYAAAMASFEKEIVIFAVMIGLFIVVLLIVGMTISKKIKGFYLSTEKLADGDLTVKFDAKGHDEIAAMANEFNLMTGNLNGMASKVELSSKKVNDSSGDLLAIAEETNTSFEKLTKRVDEIDDSTAKASEAIKEITIGVDEFAQSAQNVALSTQELSADAQSATDAVKLGENSILEVVSNMDDVTKQSEKTAEIVGEVTKNAKNVSEIVDTISGIAEQTNLLALNAAIEAARAGESGKGFAVVADEIRKLAEASQTATKRISEILNEIKHGTDLASNATRVVVENVEGTSKNVREVSKRFSEITKKINGVLDMAQNIAANAEEQGASTQEIAASMENTSKTVLEISEQIREMVKEIEGQKEENIRLMKAGNDLKELSEELESTIKKFKL